MWRHAKSVEGIHATPWNREAPIPVSPLPPSVPGAARIVSLTPNARTAAARARRGCPSDRAQRCLSARATIREATPPFLPHGKVLERFPAAASATWPEAHSHGYFPLREGGDKLFRRECTAL
jgi:hypothetical protein